VEALVDRQGRTRQRRRQRVTCRRYRSAKLGKIVAKQSRFTPLLESTSCGNRPVRRANSGFAGVGTPGCFYLTPRLALLAASADESSRLRARGHCTRATASLDEARFASEVGPEEPTRTVRPLESAGIRIGNDEYARWTLLSAGTGSGRTSCGGQGWPPSAR
jgi:hypothetical protein